MPRFFFHLHDHVDETDHQGHDLPDRDAARVEAILFAGGVLRDEPGLIRLDAPMEVKVTDEAGEAVWTVLIEVRAP